jgi:DNA-binding GntR family transcriptional regulator
MPRSTNSIRIDTAEDVVASATDVVFFGITNGLMRQTFVPGQRLIEADLALQFGVSRNTVREAMHRLEAEGIVVIVRHKGAVIRSLSRQETMDVLEVAERMMGLLASSAARSISNGQSPRKIKDALRQLVAANLATDSSTFANARRAFYRAVLETSGNSELRRLFPSIHMPIVYAQHRLPGLQELRFCDYKNICMAILKGDESIADATGATHVRNVRIEICRAIDSKI